VLTDFGLAKLMSQTSSVGTNTMLAGSPGYQSPEQLRAEECSISSDVYAFGAVMVVCLTGCTLWPGLNCYQIMQKVTSNVQPNTQGIQNDFKKICDKCFQPTNLRPHIEIVLRDLHALVFNN
jgi:serine/threonine protein kinase